MFRILRAVFVSSTGAIGWLVLVFSLFVLLGQSATPVFGVRWIIALIVVVGGSAAILVAQARRNQRDLATTKVKKTTADANK